MGSISTGVGLISGIDTASLIQQLIALDAQQKAPIFARLGNLTSSKTALMDINARLLNLKTASSSFRLDNVFRAAFAASGNESILTASAGTNAIPGTYEFTVKQLVSTSQSMSRGFSSSSLEPMGLEGISFEWGQGRLNRDVSLDALNGGNGIDRGAIRIVDRNGNTSTIDLTLATSMNEVIDEINSDPNVQVHAEVNGRRLLIKDLTNGSGSLSIQNANGSTTATDLGIEGSVVADTFTGVPVHELGSKSLLANFNDGRGVFIRDNVSDFSLRVGGAGGTSYAIDLGRIDAMINGDTLLADLNDDDGITINDNNDQPDFTIVTTTGAHVSIDLGSLIDEDGEIDEEAVTTVQEFLDRTNNALDEVLGAGEVVVSIRSDGKGIQITDSLGGVGDLEVLGAGPNGEDTARDLGIFTGDGGGAGNIITGAVIPNTVQTAQALTIQDLMDRVSSQTNGAVAVTINGNNDQIGFNADGELVQVLAGALDGSSFASTIANQTLKDLGFTSGDESILLNGERVLGGMGSVLMGSINGGQGLNGASEITITDRSGNSTTISGLDSFVTLGDLLYSVNSTLESENVDVVLSLNAERNGLIAQDLSSGSGNLVISGDGADALHIATDDSVDSFRGENLQRKYMGFATKLAELNYGRGIDTGEFRITDSNGESATIDIGNDSTTVYDVINEINSRGLAVEARINEHGDGLLLVDVNTGSPQTALKVESISGSTARDLGILKTADSVGGDIDGSYEKRVDLNTTDTLEDVILKINNAGLEVDASLLDTGTGASPYRLILSSSISGRNGDLVIDTGNADLGFSELTKAKDAKVFIGDGSQGILVESASNTLENVLAGITLNLHVASNETVTVSVSRDEESVLGAVDRFVTTFNDVISRMREYDSYDTETETRGALLGDPTVARVRSDLYRTLQQAAVGVETQYRYLHEVGIRVGKNGELEFDEARFKDAYDQDPAAVENLFSAFESEGSTTETLVPGVTVNSVGISYTSLGFGDLFDQAIGRLTNSVDGTVTFADVRFQELIDSANERIERIDERLEVKRERLENQFVAMEMALAQMQSQQGPLGMISQSLMLAQRSFG